MRPERSPHALGRHRQLVHARHDQYSMLRTAELIAGIDPLSLNDALATPFEPRLFISPPVQGWILVMGCDLPDPADDIDECFKFLTGLSRKLGEVQFFSRNRAVAQVGPFRLGGFVAWLAWCVIHIAFLVGFRNRIMVLLGWAWNYVAWRKGARLITGDPTVEIERPRDLHDKNVAQR